MNSFFTWRPMRGAWQGTLVLTAVLSQVLGTGAMLASETAHADDSGYYCLREWPNDHNAYLLCQQLQNRNQLDFRAFLSDHNLSEKLLQQGPVPDDPIASAAKHCLERWSPDYQGIWSCTKRRTRADP